MDAFFVCLSFLFSLLLILCVWHGNQTAHFLDPKNMAECVCDLAENVIFDGGNVSRFKLERRQRHFYGEAIIISILRSNIICERH